MESECLRSPVVPEAQQAACSSPYAYEGGGLGGKGGQGYVGIDNKSLSRPVTPGA